MPTLTNADRSHLNRAIEIAKTSTCRQRHGAIREFGEYAIDGFQGGNEAEFLFYKVRDNA